jgi:hypothetical protein
MTPPMVTLPDLIASKPIRSKEHFKNKNDLLAISPPLFVQAVILFGRPFCFRRSLTPD